MKRFKKATFMIIELLLRFSINPFFRAKTLKCLGANIGKNVRIYEVNFFNLQSGFSNLNIEDDVHIGTACKFDLEDKIYIGQGATISPGVTILTHADPGNYHNSPICNKFPPFVAKVIIEKYCWIGVNSTILAGAKVSKYTVIGACSLVKGTLLPESLYYGIPCKKIQALKYD